MAVTIKDVAKKASNIKAKKQVEEDPLQISLFGSGDSEKEALLEELKGLSVMEMTPLQAMQTLYDLQNKAKTLG